MAVSVATAAVIGLAAEAGGDGGEAAPFEIEVSGDEVPPPVEADGTGAAAVEGEPVAVTAGGEDEKEEEEEWLGQYSSALEEKFPKSRRSAQRILLVGDGDFSFSLALATAFGSGTNLVATSLDAYEDLKSKYCKTESNVAELKRMGATVLHGVDAKKMKLQSDLKSRKFDRIVFNFPHAGFIGKEDDMRMINSHRELVWGFFHNAVWLLRPSCEIHISHKIGSAYNKWDLEGLASGASLVLVDKVPFRQEDYPGYNQKRGEGARCDEPFNLGLCFTFKFQIGCSKDRYNTNGNMTAPATERWPFHLSPPAQTLPWEHLCPPINTVHKSMTLEPYGDAERQHLDFPLNIDGAGSVMYFHRQDNAGAMLTTPGPSLNDLPPSPYFLVLVPQEPWCEHRQQQSLRRDYEMRGQVMPRSGETSWVQIAQLEHQRLKYLRELVALYGTSSHHK
ncbi:hypothetical protein U9M48_014711 [Paspalum notatum var. saurae]|uniref:25S rRNA (uridine-N(3))-methyltransferase BMT5-like domain-containing protein n=1 Tax=Paspalum notatum var. saurae TaxID=547442 RepID=A0AAQ3T379_PASNO